MTEQDMKQKKSFFKGRFFKVCMILLGLFILANSPWMIYYKPAFRGRVLDAETKKPIEGAVVVVEYRKGVYAIIESNTAVVNVRETVTDRNGEFHIPAYLTIIAPLSWPEYAWFIIYKPCYDKYPLSSGYTYAWEPPWSKYRHGEKRFKQEQFFSAQVEEVKELWRWNLWERVGPNDFPKAIKVPVVMGVVELPRLKTREERSKALVGAPTGYGKKDLPLLFKVINEERKNLGYHGSLY